MKNEKVNIDAWLKGNLIGQMIPPIIGLIIIGACAYNARRSADKTVAKDSMAVAVSDSVKSRNVVLLDSLQNTNAR